MVLCGIHSHLWLFPGAEYVAEEEEGSSEEEEQSPELPESFSEEAKQGGQVAT